MRNALTLKGVLEGDAMPQLLIPELVKFFKRGQYPMDKMVKFYQPDEIGQAFEDSRTGNTIKPIVVLMRHSISKYKIDHPSLYLICIKLG